VVSAISPIQRFVKGVRNFELLIREEDIPFPSPNPLSSFGASNLAVLKGHSGAD